MKIEIEKTEDYELVKQGDNIPFTQCICGGETRTLELEVIPKSLGKCYIKTRKRRWCIYAKNYLYVIA